MYAITATISRTTTDDWTSTRQVPTFYLDESVQGIVNEEHAKRIAREIIDPFSEYAMHVNAVQMDAPVRFGWLAAIEAAKPEIQWQGLHDLQDRLDNADKALTDLEQSTPGGAFERKVRLAGKIEGVRLALSYVQEALRMAQPAEEAAR